MASARAACRLALLGVIVSSFLLFSCQTPRVASVPSPRHPSTTSTAILYAWSGWQICNGMALAGVKALEYQGQARRMVQLLGVAWVGFGWLSKSANAHIAQGDLHYENPHQHAFAKQVVWMSICFNLCYSLCAGPLRLTKTSQSERMLVPTGVVLALLATFALKAS